MEGWMNGGTDSRFSLHVIRTAGLPEEPMQSSRVEEVTVLHFLCFKWICCYLLLPRVFERACGRVCVCCVGGECLSVVFCVLRWYSPNRSSNYPALGKSYYVSTLLLDFALLIVGRECLIGRRVGCLLIICYSTQVSGNVYCLWL